MSDFAWCLEGKVVCTCGQEFNGNELDATLHTILRQPNRDIKVSQEVKDKWRDYRV